MKFNMTDDLINGRTAAIAALLKLLLKKKNTTKRDQENYRFNRGVRKLMFYCVYHIIENI